MSLAKTNPQTKNDQMLILVTDVVYDSEHDLVVKVAGRNESGERVIKTVYGTEPYMFVPENADIPDDPRIVEVRDSPPGADAKFESYDHRPLKQIVTEYPGQIGNQWSDSKIRDAFDKEDRYEDDVPFVRRCSADYGLAGYIRVPRNEDLIEIEDVQDVERPDQEIDPRILITDIEVRVPDTFDDEFVSEAENEITAITAWDSYEEKYTLFALDRDNVVDPMEVREELRDQWEQDEDVEIDPEKYAEADIGFRRYHDEAELLEDFITYVCELQPDIVSGWNAVDFDIVYLRNRMAQFDVGMNRMAELGEVSMKAKKRAIKGLPAMDMMVAYCRDLSYGEWRSESLDYVSTDQLGVGKIEQAEYDVNRSKFMAYNIVDVQLCVALDDMHGIHEFYFQMSDICGIPIYDVGSPMKMVEGVLFKHRTHEEILPTTKDTDVDNIRGGFVLPPSDGIKDWEGVCDLRSLYPSTMITCNISKETLTTDPEEADIITPDMPLNYEDVSGPRITEEDIGFKLEEGKSYGFSLEQEGILPKYLKLLFRERERFKELRDENEPGTSEYDTFDMKQRAVKILQNTFYGVADNPYFRLSTPGLGEAITGTSRYISWAGTRIIEEEGYELEYGDSVTGDTEVVVRDSSGIRTTEIRELAPDQDSDEKVRTDEGNMETLSVDEEGSQVFKSIEQIIKHKTDKQLYRVETSDSHSVTVTEDHSMLKWSVEGVQMVKPQYLRRGTLLPSVRQNSDRKVQGDTVKVTPVTSVEKLDSEEKYVYDLSVKDTETFLADGIFVHNTDSLIVPLIDWDREPETVELDEVLENGHELVDEINSRISDFIEPLNVPEEHPYAQVLHGTDQHLWKYEFEKVYRRFIQLGSKKRYAGNIVWKEGKKTDDIDVVGFSAVRTDTSEVAAEVQENFMSMVLRGADFEELSGYIKSKTEKIQDEEIDLKEVGMPSTINKPLEQYPERPTPRACEYGNQYLDQNWEPGDSPWIVYIESVPPGHPQTDVLAIDWADQELPEGFELNAQKHIEKMIHSPIEDTLEELRWTWGELVSGNKDLSAVDGW
jgi:DNA polymerase elongation subunit (family B)